MSRNFLCALVLCGLAVSVQAEQTVQFNRDIRPLLAAKCLPCHGPDSQRREADLRLDIRAETIESGVIEPGDPDSSELVRRVLSEDPDTQMPPPSAQNGLTRQQQELLQQWIREGAGYERHWAFVAPVKPAVPRVQLESWPRNEIDHFVLSHLESSGLQPSPAADPYTLVRRVYLDLIGMPPTVEEADAFVTDCDPQTYEKLVDKLLDSPQYGERWARPWLDLARYADTNGYEKDRDRSIWPYRDWVIRALNADLPFDRFTVAQLAGDMLPAATQDQIVATGFHRNTMLNEEGGIDPLEYRYYAMVDRVATTGTVWLGLSTGCAQCHAHKYDPITHEDYYRLLALMNNTDEPDYVVKTADIVQRRSELEQRIHQLESELPQQFPPLDGDGPLEQRRSANLEQSFAAWCGQQRSQAQPWKILVPDSLESNLPKLELLSDGSVFSTGDITKRDVYRLRFQLDESCLPITALRLEVLPDERLPAGGPGRAYYEGRKGDFFLSEVTAQFDGQRVTLASASHDYGKIAVGSGDAKAENVLDGNGSTGWSTANAEGQPHQLILNLAEPMEVEGVLEIELLFERHFAAGLGRFRFAAVASPAPLKVHDLPVEIEQLLAHPAEGIDDEDLQRLRSYYLRVAPELAEARKPIDQLRARLPEFPTTMVMQQRPADNPRHTYRHHRGEYLSPREQVQPGLPAFLTGDAERGPGDRLELARWLASRQNPLVGRVTVNRAWQALFGTGLHRTSDDFGTQSEPPVHGELLDWLACEFMDRGWSQKRLHRLIVTSATYRQSSHATAELLASDPRNEQLARGPRFRVDAELVRDIMFAPAAYCGTECTVPVCGRHSQRA